jgi:hypothetical protein
MRRKNNALFSIGVAVVAAGLGTTGARAAITVDGNLDGDYGVPLAVGQVPTSAGDSTTVATNQGYSDGSELDATYGTIQNNTLYLFFAGNLGGTNNLDIFIQTGTGGSNQFQQYIGTTPNRGKNVPLNRLSGVWTGSTNRGLQFDSGFAPNYALTINSPGGSPTDTHNADFNSYMNYVNINTGVDGFLGYGNPGTPGTYNNNQSGSQNVLGISYGFNNSNTAGVTSTSVGNPSAVTTGFEFAIPLANITEAGQAAPSTVEVAAIMDNNGRDTVYNQVTGLQPGYNGANGSNNNSLGDPTYAGATNFNNDSGLQYVTIAVPEPASAGLLGLASLGLIARRRSRTAR